MQSLVLLASQELLASGKAGLSILLQGPMGVQLHAKGSDGKRETKLRLTVAKHEVALDIPLGEAFLRHKSNHLRFSAAHQLLLHRHETVCVSV